MQGRDDAIGSGRRRELRREGIGVPIFPALSFRRTASAEVPGHDLPEAVRQQLPMRFEAVGEALVSDADVVAACAVVGRDVARDRAAPGGGPSRARAALPPLPGPAP